MAATKQATLAYRWAGDEEITGVSLPDAPTLPRVLGSPALRSGVRTDAPPFGMRRVTAYTRRMTRSTYFVLASLLDARRHGYAIVQSVEQMSDGQLRLTTGTLYGALERLQLQGLIEPDGEEVVDSRLRRYYRLTDEGVDAVREETARMRRAINAIEPRLAARGATA